MIQFHSILFYARPSEGLEEALARAANLARKCGASLSVVDVLERLPRDLLRLLPAVGPEMLQELAASERVMRMEQLLRRHRGEGLTAASRLLMGRACAEIAAEAERNGHDLVIVAHDSRESVLDRLLGGVAVRLISNCPCPVLVAQPTGTSGRRGVMAAVDLNPRGGRLAENTRRILELATSIARLEGSPLRIVHVWNAVDVASFGARAELPLPGREAAEAELDRLLAQMNLRGLEYDIHVLTGDPRLSVARFAATEGIDLAVMGSAGERGLSRLLDRNLTEKVLRRGGCSVLAVKPARSPAPSRLRAA
ncbi:MAG: universal stress protein [Bryobacteraceae bacterium]|nr:universal stress protein [Bryobacteraceae bacterium]